MYTSSCDVFHEENNVQETLHHHLPEDCSDLHYDIPSQENGLEEDRHVSNTLLVDRSHF